MIEMSHIVGLANANWGRWLLGHDISLNARHSGGLPSLTRVPPSPPDSIFPPAPMNHVRYLRPGPAEMPFQNTTNTNHFPQLTDTVWWK